MNPFRNGDLQPISPDAAELIDKDAMTRYAKILETASRMLDASDEITRLENEALDFMTRLRRKDEEIVRMKEAIKEWHLAVEASVEFLLNATQDSPEFGVEMQRRAAAEVKLHGIAREEP